MEDQTIETKVKAPADPTTTTKTSPTTTTAPVESDSSSKSTKEPSAASAGTNNSMNPRSEGGATLSAEKILSKLPRERFGILHSFWAQLVAAMIALMLPVVSWVLHTRMNPHPMFPMLGDAELTENLRGRDILVIGGTEGIGAALANELNRHGSSLTVTSAAKATQKYIPRGVEFVHANISTMRGAEDLGANLLRGRRFDTVVFAGGFVPRPLIFTYGEGVEEDLHTSYLSRFIIVNELVRNNILTGRRRIYILAYPGDDRMMADFEDQKIDWTDYKEITSQTNTIVFNDALIKEAAKRFPDIRVFGVNPGFLSRGGASDIQWVDKSFLSKFIEWFLTLGLNSPEQYVRQTLVQIIASPDLELKSGIYINDKCEELPPKRWFSKEANRQLVWEHSEKMVQKALG